MTEVLYCITMSGPPQFLLDHYAHLLNARKQDVSSTGPESSPAESFRPHITLTWAQSLDAKIAGPGGSRVILSGPESMLMTHWYVATL
jgi:2,5-diamino-6-(ribosylamino)-4(3H)-pyrimidinone 5'-phosphate reductase